MILAYVIPHFQKYGGIRRILTLTNKLSKKHEVYLIPENGFSCDWMPVQSRIANLSYFQKTKWDAVIYSLESQYALLHNVEAKAKIHYILHYGVVYKNVDDCLASYKEPTYKIANSTWTAKMLKKHIGYTPPIVYGGIDPALFHPCKELKHYDVLTYGDTRREWKGRGDVEVIQGEHPEWKIAYMYDINPDQKDIAKVYSRSKVFFSASWYEGWNWMGLEAMACGTPLVITKDGGSADYARHGYNCLTVEPQDIKGAQKALNALLTNRNLARKLSNNGLKTAAKYTWDKSAHDFELQIKQAIYEKSK